MNHINIPLRQRIVKIFFIVIGTIVFSIFYFFSNLKTMDNNIQMFKKRVDEWEQKVLQIKKKIKKTEKKIKDKYDKINVAFLNEEIDELNNIYNSICKYIFEKYKIKCIFQGVHKDSQYINVIRINIKVSTNNLKSTIIAANILSFLTNKFITSKTNIKVKKIKITEDNKIIIELYKTK